MIKFGTGGFRAIIGDDFTRANVNLLMQGLANKIKKEKAEDKPVVIGYDNRFLSDLGAKWCAEVLSANNIPVWLIKESCPTPIPMFVVKNLGSEYGLAITASHNPAIYNGIKVFTKGGRDATEEVTNEIEAEIAKITDKDVLIMDFDDAVAKGITKIINPKNEYVDSILNFVNVEAIKKANMKVLVDPMFGVSKSSLNMVLNTCRCDVDMIHAEHDAFFGGRVPSPSDETLETLKRKVVEGKYDLGIATDGDADRIGLIDTKGNYIHPNDILVLLYYYLVKYKGWAGDAVRNIATSHLLDKVATDLGFTCHEVPVGFKHISQRMQETGALIGGESSGGLTVKGHIFGKDGVYAAALLIEMIAVIGKPLFEILKEIKDKYGYLYMGEYNVSFKMETKSRLMKLLFEDKQVPVFPIEIERISYLDGLKFYFANGGWLICRFSGTEPVLRIFCEQENKQKADQITDVMIKFLGL